MRHFLMKIENMESKVCVRVSENERQVAARVCSFVVNTANEAIARTGRFTIGLSGGSAAKYLSEGLQHLETDWSKWRIFFCDERHVSADDPDSTFGFYNKHLFQHVPVSLDHIFTDNISLSVEDAANDYSSKLKSVFGDMSIPRFDVLLLGMGPDGHTCSLFPGHPLLQEKNRWVAPISDSPKPPPVRITLTLPVLLNTQFAVFVACGASKAEIVKRVVESTEEPPLPAAMVRPSNGEVVWFLDNCAASALSSTYRS